MPNINITLTEDELSSAISSLLFSCSVNITSDTDLGYQQTLLELAKKLKSLKEDIQLNKIQFVKEEDYEDIITEDIYNCFKNNLTITTFDYV